ncbi:hypothetical protein D3C83_145110 [compost metagenome]
MRVIVFGGSFGGGGGGGGGLGGSMKLTRVTSSSLSAFFCEVTGAISVMNTTTCKAIANDVPAMRGQLIVCLGFS